MSRLRNILFAVAIGGSFAAGLLAQTLPDPPSRIVKSGSADRKIEKVKPAEKSSTEKLRELENQLNQAQSKMQQQQEQIDRLEKSLQQSVETLQEQQRQLQASVVETRTTAVAAKETASHADSEVTRVEGTVASVSESVREQGTQVAGLGNSVTIVQKSLDEQNRHVMELEAPDSIRYKGLDITPVGFFEATSLVRNRNENADIASTWTGLPLNGSTNSKLSEYRGSARDSRLGMQVQGHAGSTTITGYVETDFLGAAPSANYVQSSAFTPRIRQAWGRIQWGDGWSATAGQFWSLMTTNRQGLAPRQEFIPDEMDGSYVVGFNWVRERSIRITKNFQNRIWAAFEIDDPENTYSAAYTPENVMGLNTSQNSATGTLLLPYLANYSNGNSTTFMPDFMGKVVFEPGWGHFEIKMLGRIFRDRIASTATTAGRMNFTEGYGIGFGAVLPVVKSKLDVIAEGMVGEGIGRYGEAGLPDTTLNPVTGAMQPLREGRFLAGIEYFARKNVKLFAYAGDEYAGRYAEIGPGGVPAGYGSPLVSYAACTNEVALNTCSGANRNVYEFTGGYWYYLYQGRFGRLQYGNQIGYAHRSLWAGTGKTPQGADTMLFSSVRFYLP